MKGIAEFGEDKEGNPTFSYRMLYNTKSLFPSNLKPDKNCKVVFNWRSPAYFDCFAVLCKNWVG